MAKKAGKQLVLEVHTVESRPISPDETIAAGTLLVMNDARDGREWFLVAQSGFGMNANGDGKIIGCIGKGLDDLRKNIERVKADDEEGKRTGRFKIYWEEEHPPLSFFYRCRDVRVVTTPVDL